MLKIKLQTKSQMPNQTQLHKKEERFQVEVEILSIAEEIWMWFLKVQEAIWDAIQKALTIYQKQDLK